MIQFIKYIGCVVALTPTLLVAQPTVITSTPAAITQSAILANYIREGLTNNLEIRQESLDISRVKESINQARSLFYPRLSFNPTYSLATGGRRLEFPVSDPFPLVG